MMKVSRDQVAANRQRILDAASRLFRERGFEAVTVGEIMKSAGLTHGAFYGHFASKDDLIAHSVAHALASTPVPANLTRFASGYLSSRHRDDIAGGCPVAALGSETIRQTPKARAAMTVALRRQIERLSEGVPDSEQADGRQIAIGSWAAMVGALILARLSDDPELADEVLAQTRAWIGRFDAEGSLSAGPRSDAQGR
jgi:TetR/AcrR family transcriptional repressor of nem operon